MFVLIIMTPKFWNIKSTDECNDELINSIKDTNNQKHFLLDVKKTKMNLLEKFVHETSLFHFTTLEDNYVEFWCEDKVTQNLNFESDKFPIKSCISYFNQNKCPTIISNIDIDSYLYKEFESKTDFILSFPRSNKQITFDGKWLSSSVILSENDESQERYAIFVNLWHSKPSDVEYYKEEENNNEFAPVILSIDEDINVEKIVVSKEIMNAQLYENLLYKCEKTALSEFASFINDATHSYKFVKESNIKKMEKMKSYSKIYTPDMCRYIINESEKHSINDSTNSWDFSIDKMPSAFGLILETMTTVIEKVKELHNLNEKIQINIKNLFVRKSFTNSDQTREEMKQNNSTISINILLSKNDEKNETHIADNTQIVLEQGDLLIHSDNLRCKVTGVQYNLIGFININKSESESESEFDCCAVSF